MRPWALALVPAFALAQSVTPLPPQHGVNFDIGAPHYAISQVDSTLFARTLVQSGNNNAFHWNMFGVLDNYGTGGENVGLYIKANQYSTGATWGIVSEAQCLSLTGNSCWGMEVDLMAPMGQEARGYGVGIFVGRANPFSPLRNPSDHRVGHALAGFFVNANQADSPYVDIAVAYDTQIHCTVACFRLPMGESFAWELTGSVVTKLDPQTGYWGLWREPAHTCVWCVNADTGDEKRMWKP